METNPLRERWRESKAVVNGWIAIPDGFAAETMARQGWDSITVDMQHGVTHYDTAVECLRAITTTPTVPLARVPWNEPGIIMKALDGGAFGGGVPDDRQPRGGRALRRRLPLPSGRLPQHRAGFGRASTRVRTTSRGRRSWW